MFSDGYIFKKTTEHQRKKSENKRIIFHWNKHLYGYRVNERTVMKIASLVKNAVKF